MAVESDVERVVAAIRAGLPVLIPTDTVYGLAASAYSESDAQRLYELKGRQEERPTALLAASVEQLLETVPELRGDGEVIVRTLLPGPYTLVLSNPARRFRWLSRIRPDTIGVRVPDVPPELAAVIDAVGPLLATSANEPGGPSPAGLDDVPTRIRAGCGAELDLGRLPGTASTVLDFTGPEPHVVREGAAPSAEAIARVRAALAV